ncbi:MAG: LysM peptidoglycan-binding domain-containing protein [Anaerolineae bacterium]|nr:LysM peptidoglycan-binding domain-containing protein [Anaerolineae bacterium]MDW8102760.1 LysM peptidoglycan-binding domain-containing protein [Anaerolineae bacterium]
MKRVLVILCASVLLLAGCTRPKPAPTPTPTPKPSPVGLVVPQPSPTPVETVPTQPPQPEPTPQPQQPEPTPTPLPAQGYINYTVKWGDTLESIAYRFGTTVEELVRINNLANPNLIYIGQVLKVPGTAQAVPPPSAVSEYIVQPGDTIWSIAVRFNTTVEAIAIANRLINPNFIYVGQKLIIPSPGKAPAQVSRPRIHIVRYGETLTSIAFRYGTTVEAIMRANNLPNPNFIYVGQRLIIP